MELSGPYLAACALLLVAGLAKARRPGDTARALAAALGPPTTAARERRFVHLVRTGSLLEAALGLAAPVYLSPVLSAAVATSYAAFAAFVVVARRRGGPLSTCGCFGALDTPPTVLHLVLDVGLCASAVCVAADGARGWTTRWLGHQPWHGLPLVLVSVVLTWFVALCLIDGARVVAARRLLRRPATPRGEHA